MIVTVTANPSLDRTVQVAELRRGGVLRADHTTDEPGGKGVNVSRALATHGCKTVAVVCVGGTDGRRLVDLLDEAGVAVRPVPVSGPTRTNLTLAEPDGVVTKVNLPGPHLPPRDVEALVAAVGEAAEPG
ncbi:PfkB family carbohydrate kinase, partial [Saccharomonospora saliphila]|uniref:PfkB family carbohydrate kinase n=1 Tax=Saccharomonospora saliphila TaxID=369829 RepID=UPI0003617E94